MKGRELFAGCLFLVIAATTGAQPKISGTMECNKPEPAYSIEVGDRPGHIMLLVKQACAWTGPDIL